MLTLYNSLTQKKERFQPQNPPKVLMYVCGITAYDDAHIGHARAAVVFDMLRRYLEQKGYHVQHVQNFTDIDDKIIARAKQEGLQETQLSNLFIKRYLKDMASLNVCPAHQYPKATDHVSDMISLIQTLMDKGVAYAAKGDILFSIDQFPDYGKLSKKVLEDLVAGHRVERGDHKKNPLDFVLWKQSKPGEPSWDSPFGKGRPGWHIECSAMVFKTLGLSIDIHGGGQDLIFPHHENEIAQSEACSHQPFAQYWVHNGFVTVHHEKMSKSLKNFWTIRDVLQHFHGQILRFFLLKAHYRMPINFSFDGLKEAQQAFFRLQHTFKVVLQEEPQSEPDFDALYQRFLQALNDDLNTPEAIGILFDMNKLIHKTKSGLRYLKTMMELLGLCVLEETASPIPVNILNLIKERQDAKKNKDYAKADALRQALSTQYQVTLEESKDDILVMSQGQHWRVLLQDLY